MADLLRRFYRGLLVVVTWASGLTSLMLLGQTALATAKGEASWPQWVVVALGFWITLWVYRRFDAIRTKEQAAVFIIAQGSTSFSTFRLRLDIDKEKRTVTVNRSYTFPAAEMEYKLEEITKTVTYSGGSTQNVTLYGPSGVTTGTAYVSGPGGSYTKLAGYKVWVRHVRKEGRLRTLRYSRSDKDTAEAVISVLERIKVWGQK